MNGLHPDVPDSLPSSPKVAVSSVPSSAGDAAGLPERRHRPLARDGGGRESQQLGAVVVEQHESPLIDAPRAHPLQRRVETRLDRAGGFRAGHPRAGDRPQTELATVDGEGGVEAVAARRAADLPVGEGRTRRACSQPSTSTPEDSAHASPCSADGSGAAASSSPHPTSTPSNNPSASPLTPGSAGSPRPSRARGCRRGAARARGRRRAARGERSRRSRRSWPRRRRPRA